VSKHIVDRCKVWPDDDGDIQDSQGVSASEMTYIVSGGALNSTHSLIGQMAGVSDV